MSLVAYGDSDCESDEDNGTVTEVPKSSSNNILIEPKIVTSKSFLTLPQPKSNLNVKTSKSYDSDEEEKPAVPSKKQIASVQETKEGHLLFPTLPKPKTGGKVKIIIPSLNEVFILQK